VTNESLRTYKKARHQLIEELPEIKSVMQFIKRDSSTGRLDSLTMVSVKR
jgi:hypothetical protein